MTPKKKKIKTRRLKPGVKKAIVCLILLIGFLIYTGIKINEVKKIIAYKKTYEYKLIEKGYPKEQAVLLSTNVDDQYLEDILNKRKIEDKYYNIAKEKYYIRSYYSKYLEYLDENSRLDVKDVIAVVNVKASDGWYFDVFDTNIDDGYGMIVNKFFKLSADYKRNDMKSFNLKYAYAENLAAEVVVIEYDNMYNDILDELGVHLMVNSSYRSYKDQEVTYNSYRNAYGQKYADSYAARPGHSEHQTGLAIDITSLEHKSQKDFTSSEEYEWLKNNCYKYGFILRYPEGKNHITGYSSESWHFRYVGKTIAAVIHDEDITFDEYYAFYKIKH